MLKYFKSSLVVSVIGIILGFLLAGPKGAFIVAVLGVLETSLSFDNAVVNATVLKDMSPEWRHRFITWGMVIAVFGMRVVFPVLIVMVTSGLSPVDVIDMALNKPNDYAAALTASHISIAGFGGAFLFMVFLAFFIDAEKEVHWIGALEAPLATLAKIEAIQIAITLAAIFGFSQFLPKDEISTFLIAGVFGIIAHILVDGIGVFLDGEEDSDNVKLTVPVAKAGLASFMYLELLDASFSFDGVLGAFALSTNIFIIAIGLGIGAMFVRSLTLMLVDKGTLDQFKYLEHGAFYAIASLAIIMFAGTIHEIPEVVTGLIGAGFIGIALISSIIYNRKMAGSAAAI